MVAQKADGSCYGGSVWIVTVADAEQSLRSVDVASAAAMLDRRPVQTKGARRPVIDRIRQDIQERLDQLLAEADKLRRALSALDPRERSTAPRTQRSTQLTASKPAATRSASKAGFPTSPPAPTGIRAASAPARAASGATKAKVLSALSGNGALTAGDVANATGLGRPTVSTTLSKLAKNGELFKAERGYRLPASADAPDAA